MAVLQELSITPVNACCTPFTSETLSSDEAESMALAFKALGDPTRLRLLSIVANSEGQEACVCDLTEPVGLSQPTVSHHLKLLLDAGYITRSKRGTWSYYRLVPGSLERVSKVLTTAL